jgi:hypothetical protein
VQGTRGKGGQLRLLAGAALAALAILLSGCVTVPISRAEAPELYLRPDQSVYFAADIRDARQTVAEVAQELGFDASITARIDQVAGSAGNPPGPAVGTPEIVVVALGRLPRGATRFGLWTDRGWKRTVIRTDAGRVVYYAQRDGRLELMPLESGALLISSVPVATLLDEYASAGVELSGAAAEDSVPSVRTRALIVATANANPASPADIVIALEDPSLLFASQGIDAPQFPVVRALILLDLESTPDDGASPVRAIVDLELVMESPLEAALFGRLGRGFLVVLARTAGISAGEVQESVEIVVEENRVGFLNIPVDLATVLELVRVGEDLP